MNYRLECRSAGYIPREITDVVLLWTQLPAVDWSIVSVELRPWYSHMHKYGVILASKRDFLDETDLRESIREDILDFTMPNDLVVDPFCGSSNVGQIALELNRRYYGSDISRAAIERSKDRLSVYA